MAGPIYRDGKGVVGGRKIGQKAHHESLYRGVKSITNRVDGRGETEITIGPSCGVKRENNGGYAS